MESRKELRNNCREKEVKARSALRFLSARTQGCCLGDLEFPNVNIEEPFEHREV